MAITKGITVDTGLHGVDLAGDIIDQSRRDLGSDDPRLGHETRSTRRRSAASAKRSRR